MTLTLKTSNKASAAKTVYDLEMIKLINLFEKLTRARVKDAFYLKEVLTFVVDEGDIYKALGKNLANLHHMEDLLKKKIKIVEYSPDIAKFVANLIYPYRVQEIRQENKIVTITDSDSKTKGLIIGARAQNLRIYEGIVKKYFDIEEMKVI